MKDERSVPEIVVKKRQRNYLLTPHFGVSVALQGGPLSSYLRVSVGILPDYSLTDPSRVNQVRSDLDLRDSLLSTKS